MPTEDITPEDARRALSEISAREQGSAARLEWPLWRELVLTGLVSGMVLAPLAARPFDILLIIACCGGILAMVRDYTRQPVWVSGYRKGRTQPMTFVFAGFVIALYLGSFAGYQATGLWWIPVAASALMFLGFTVFNRIWMAVWRAEIREGGA